MDFLLNIVSKPLKGSRTKTKSSALNKTNSKETISKDATKSKKDEKPILSTKIPNKHEFTDTHKDKNSFSIAKRKMFGTFRKSAPEVRSVNQSSKIKRKSSLILEEPPAKFINAIGQSASTESSDEENSVEAAIEIKKQSSNSTPKDRKRSIKKDKQKKTKEDAMAAKKIRSDPLDCLTSLINEPIEAKIEGLFSEKKFADCDELHPFIRKYLIEKMELVTMTEVQVKCLQPLLDGKDALVKAQTGSGKTLAYALPIVQSLQDFEPPITRQSGPVAVIIVPTREMVSQTYDTFQKLLQPFVRIVCGCLTGGIRKKAQKASLRKGLNVLIVTPQRLLDHIESTSCLDLSNLKWLVIDEADRLLEIGFERSVARILRAINSQRDDSSPRLQTVLLSATLTPAVNHLAGLTLSDPVDLSVSDEMSSVAMPAGLRHFVVIPPTKQRLVTLAAFLLLKCRYTKENGKVIVFFATQDSVDFHYSLFTNTIACSSDDLALPGITTEVEFFRLHGSMEHQARMSVFRRFSSCNVGGVLLTTDVSCRGLDLPRVAWVVQYHVPGRPVDYIHRVGRTARAGGEGKALIFLQPQETEYLRVLAGLGVHAEELPIKTILQTALVHVNNSRMAKSKGKGKGKPHRVLESREMAAVMLQREFERHVSNADDGCLALAEQAYVSFLRSYASFSGPMRHIFRFKELHLGHVARSFALRDTPTDISAKVTGRAPHKRESVTSAETPRHSADNDLAKKHMLAEFGI